MSMNIEAIQHSVRTVLQGRPRGISEYELITEVGNQGLLDFCAGLSATVALFQKHFVIMHVLYRLQDDFALRGQTLHIDPLSIEVLSQAHVRESGEVDQSPSAPLRRYYLDMDNFCETGEEDILTLLAGFWGRYQAWENADDAYTVLGLEVTASWSEIQAAYRRQIRYAHPDKGGDATRFREIFEAYQSLKLRVKPV